MKDILVVIWLLIFWVVFIIFNKILLWFLKENNYVNIRVLNNVYCLLYVIFDVDLRLCSIYCINVKNYDRSLLISF